MKKAIFALNSAKTFAIFIEVISPDNFPSTPTPDTFPWWNGIQLVVATTNDDVVDWFIDGNPFVKLVETENLYEYKIMRTEHAPHITDPWKDFGATEDTNILRSRLINNHSIH